MRRARGPLAGAQDTGVFQSLGYTLFDWLNPDTVRAEAEALGTTPPAQTTFGDVIGAAVEDTRDVVVGAKNEITQGAQAVVGGASKLALGLAVTAAIAGAIYLSQKRRRR